MLMVDNNIPVYQEVTRTPNVMANLNPLRQTKSKTVGLDQRVRELSGNQTWQNLMWTYRVLGTKWDPKMRPKVAMVDLSKIQIDEDIQRALDRRHAAAIADPDSFDPRLLQVIYCVKTPGKHIYHAVDGQHTATVLAAMVQAGLFEDESDWKTVQVPVSYIETTDKSFARNAFALINGRGKKKISNWYQHRTRVQSVRIDKSKLRENVEAEAKQTICEKHHCYPVDKDSEFVGQPGTFTHMEALNLDNTVLDTCCAWHNRYFHYHSVDGSLWFVLPQIITSLRHSGGVFDDNFQKELAGIVQGLFGSLKQFHSSVKQAYQLWYKDYYAVSEDYTPTWDSDSLGCALAQLYVRLGGSHQLPLPLVNHFTNITNWFDESITSQFER